MSYTTASYSIDDPSSWILEALNLIKELDKKRFNRLQKEISWVVCTPLREFGEYRRLPRVCAVDLEKLSKPDDRAYSIKELACTVIHEATHGRLHSLHIPHRRSTKIRIERICIKEEQRFAKRFGDGFDWHSYLDTH